MVRGSTVRVRQRALQRPRKPELLLSAHLQTVERDVGMEPFMEPSGPECLAECVKTDGFARFGRSDTSGRGGVSLTRTSRHNRV